MCSLHTFLFFCAGLARQMAAAGFLPAPLARTSRARGAPVRALAASAGAVWLVSLLFALVARGGAMAQGQLLMLTAIMGASVSYGLQLGAFVALRRRAAARLAAQGGPGGGKDDDGDGDDVGFRSPLGVPGAAVCALLVLGIVGVTVGERAAATGGGRVGGPAQLAAVLGFSAAVAAGGAAYYRWRRLDTRVWRPPEEQLLGGEGTRGADDAAGAEGADSGGSGSDGGGYGSVSPRGDDGRGGDGVVALDDVAVT